MSATDEFENIIGGLAEEMLCDFCEEYAIEFSVDVEGVQFTCCHHCLSIYFEFRAASKMQGINPTDQNQANWLFGYACGQAQAPGHYQQCKKHHKIYDQRTDVEGGLKEVNCCTWCGFAMIGHQAFEGTYERDNMEVVSNIMRLFIAHQ